MLKEIRIPESDLKLYMKFIKVPPGQQDLILQKFSDISPTVTLKSIEILIMKELKYEQKDSQDFIRFLLNFYINYFFFKGTIEEFNEEVIIPSFILAKSKLKIEEKDFNKIKSITEKILSLDKTIGIISKISYLSDENPNHYLTSHLITDLRYIFYNDPTEIPDYALIKHTLKLNYFSNKKLQEIFITLDTEDLKELKNNIKRAIKKEKSLRELCKRNRTNILKEEGYNGK